MRSKLGWSDSAATPPTATKPTQAIAKLHLIFNIASQIHDRNGSKRDNEHYCRTPDIFSLGLCLGRDQPEIDRIFFLVSVHSTWLSQFTQFEFTRMVKPSNENSLSSDLPKSLSHFSWAL